MPYKIAGIDVHKRMLHVVVSDVQVDGEYDFTRRVFGSLPEALRSLATWLVEQQVEQRLWRTVVRTKYQLTRNRVQLQNRLEALLEEAHIKLSSLVSDLLGASARRMLEAIAGGETNRETLAALADRGLRATQEQLQDALGVCQELNPVYAG